jgi:hypothetical protein
VAGLNAQQVMVAQDEYRNAIDVGTAARRRSIGNGHPARSRSGENPSHIVAGL